MLVVTVSDPPPETDKFYTCCSFHVDTAEAKVFIAERGKHSLLKLRFLPDEVKENKIRAQDFGEATAKKVDHVLSSMQRQQEKAEEEVREKRKRKEDRVEAMKDRKLIGEQGKSDAKELGVSLNDHISRARASITVMTSSWGDCTAGPLGMNIPAGLLPQKSLDKFNDEHRGEAYAVMSSSRSHFMTSPSWTDMLYNLYTPAFDKQRTKYSLSLAARGKFMADAWTGFRAEEGSIERSTWEELNAVEMPTAVQRSVTKFTRSRSQLLAGVRDPGHLTEKQVQALRKLFSSKMWMVFLPRSQSMALPSWLAKHTRLKDNGDMELTTNRNKPQLLCMEFEAAVNEGDVVDYIHGGEFSISGPQFPPSKVRCVALQPSESSSAPEWRLENYDVDDVEADQEDPSAHGADEEDEADAFQDTSDEEDENLHAPADFFDVGHGFEGDQEAGSDLESLDGEEPQETWCCDAEEVLDVNAAPTHAQAENLEGDEQAISAPIQRPRGKLDAAEWKLLAEEGWFDKLPHVAGTTLSKHSKQQAWSSKYGSEHFARHISEHRSAVVALLMCMEWLVEKHYLKSGDEKMAALHQELKMRRYIEDCLPMVHPCLYNFP
eukprot:Skav207860  [mRNA]  locus=scaffold1988:72409:76968:- [translate_table: standard]